MDAKTESTIRQEQIESFGHLMAGFSHDMKNHLGIIRESNGLMGDIIAMGGLADDETAVERLKKIISSIENRVVISANMFHQLSKLAHRSDTPYSSFQVNDLITEEFTFLERFSRLKEIHIKLKLGENISPLYNDPSLLQHVFYRVYILCLEQLESGHSLEIITGQDEKEVKITFRLIGVAELNLEQLSGNNLPPAITKLAGTLGAGASTADYADITLTIGSLADQD